MEDHHAHDNMNHWMQEVSSGFLSNTILEKKVISTVVLLGTAGGSPESPCLGIAVPEWHCTWRPPVQK